MGGCLEQHHCQGLSEDQFSDMFRKCWPRVLAVARSFGGDPGWAEDLAQDAFLRTWRERTRLASAEAATAFTIIVVGRLGRNARRDAERRRKKLELYAPENGSGSPLEDVQLTELEASLHYLEVQMPRRDRELYRLAWVKYREPKEIAAALGVSEKTVRNRMSVVKRFVLAHVRHMAEG
jgi:RNA polymerase sigma-70 factor (ECF subfamily)